MFIPLHDANSLKHIKAQYVTLALIGVNVAVYLAVNLDLVSGAYEAAVFSFGYIPAVVNDIVELPPGRVIIPEELSLVSYAFLHGSFMHLASNMLFLWVFGDNVEDALGHVRFLVFYLACAVAGALAHGFLVPDSTAPLIGASGAISGIIGAYLILHPKVRIWVLAFGRIPLRLPAAIPLLLWIAFQLANVLLDADDGVSWAAHVGGFVAGAVLVVVMRRRGVPLFDRDIVLPKAVEIREGRPERPADGEDAKPMPWGRG
ncbi:rhomboid family intramembrane serine protease [Oricola thermophila]|uniref:Rhomboid family intramembrane serine protease n=1 Tax=Oricola thermophila TaxID=2742145 RepID=A0A6N1VHC6_9HYPH|nr:rhomboid family intramembrane serine protease [Oricola thermophila]QKV20290.1 rhomboid family intramembrane serine protease [Oricola thermophila]